MKRFREFLGEAYKLSPEKVAYLRSERARERHPRGEDEPELKCKNCGWRGMVADVEDTKGACPKCDKQGHIVMEEYEPTLEGPALSYGQCDQCGKEGVVRPRVMGEHGGAHLCPSCYKETEGKPL